jgi:hypothetical protein
VAVLVSLKNVSSVEERVDCVTSESLRGEWPNWPGSVFHESKISTKILTESEATK